MRFKALLLWTVMWSLGCVESSVERDTDRLGWDYFPVNVGSYRIYDVDETTYNLVGPDQQHYQLRESIVDSTQSNEEINLTVHREVRMTETDEWHLDSIWTARINANRAIVVENNVPFIKLSFPIKNQLTWDGNAANVRNTDTYRYDNLPADTVLFDQPYVDLWKVVQSDFGEDFLGRNDRYEIYAPNVGLIIKQVVIWNYCQTDCSSEKQIVAGRELTQTLLEYGNLLDENE